MKQLPVRRHLPHTPPPSVAPFAAGAPFFLTICVNRGHYGIGEYEAGRRGPLTDDALANAILDSIEFRRENGEWHPHLATVMPDHLHIITAFAPEISMREAISSFKRFLASRYGIVWQDGFFDHRLRNDEEHDEKMRYIRDNAKEKGLCSQAELWPWLRIWPQPW